MPETINVGLIGFGTVGSGTARIMLEQKELLSRRAGCELNLLKICDKDISTDRGFHVPEQILTTDINDILENPDIHIVIELIGGVEPAKSFILRAMDNGKHVVTANKALLATHGREIFQTAVGKGVEIGFEASVGGGIPVIKSVKEGLVANNLQAVLGIMNGTANYILTSMTDTGISFSEALSQAQKLGYAEADPTYDIEGIDTAHKLAIMAMLSFGCRVELDDIYTQGISDLEPIDIAFASEFGYRIKLLAIAKTHQDGLELRIHPTMLPETHLLAQVNQAYNAIYLVGDSVGTVMLYGLGAGQMPTGSAVVADVVDIARNISKGSVNRVCSTGLPYDTLKKANLRPMAETTGRYYFRFSAADRPGILARIAGILGDHGISIDSVVQKGRGKQNAVPVVMLTHEAREEQVQSALKKIDNLDVVTDRTVLIRVESEDSLQ